MIYFLINNNYHFDLDLKLAKQLPNYELGLIQVPYSLNIITNSDLFSKIYYFPNKITSSITDFFFHSLRILAIQKYVHQRLKPNSDDILLVHTDMDLLNQYIIQVFYNAKAKIYLLEDGTSTMCTYNLIPHKAPLKDRIKTLILHHIYKFKYTKIAVYGQQILPVMKDFVFKGVIVNFGNSIRRNIPFFKLTQVKEPIEILHENGAIFLNQGLYSWYLKEDEYISYINNLLAISENFNPFYFKFHPSDIKSVKNAITKLIVERYSNIIIIEDNDIAEILIQKYPVRYAITFNSTAALNLINKGIVPIFLNQLINNIFPNSEFTAFDQFLKSINCHVPAKLSDIKPGFSALPSAQKNINTKSIVDILK